MHMGGEQHTRRWGMVRCADEANSIRNVASVTMDDSGLRNTCPCSLWRCHSVGKRLDGYSDMLDYKIDVPTPTAQNARRLGILEYSVIGGVIERI